MPGLTLAQRLNYVASTFTYFESLQKLVYLLVPVIVLLTGISPLRVDAGDYVLHALPFFALMSLANIALGRGNFRLVAVEQYNVLKMFLFIWATVQLVWPRTLRFKVTPKAADQGVYAGERRALWMHFLLLVIVLLSVVLAGVNLLWGVGLGSQRPDLIMLTMVWALANAALLSSGAAMVLGRLYSRREYRFPIRLSTTVSQPNGRAMAAYTEDLSRKGCGLFTEAGVPIGTRLSLQLATPGRTLNIAGSVLRCERLPNAQYRLGVTFDEMPGSASAELIEFLFVVAAHHQKRGDIRTIDPGQPLPDKVELAA